MKIIDLSHPIDNSTPVYPGSSNLSLVQNRWMAKDHYNGFIMQTQLHIGTHVDMPMHMAENPMKAWDYPLERFAGPGLALDCRGQEMIRPNETWEAVTDQTVPILVTGWSAYFGRPEFFTAHPLLSMEAAEFLIARGVGMVAMDIPTPDRSDYPVHRALCQAGILLVENLRQPEPLLDLSSFQFMALPLNMPTEASLVRAVAITDEA